MNFVVAFHVGRTRRLRCRMLERFRRPVFAWVQLLALLFLILHPATVSRAIYLPDATDQPYWFPLSENDPAPAEGPNWTEDGAGHPAWWNTFQNARDNGVVVWWGGEIISLMAAG